MVVDASVWISRLLPLDSHHVASRSWLESYQATGRILFGPTLLLVEVAGAVARQTRQAAIAAEAINQLMRSPRIRLVPMQAALMRTAAEMAASLRLRGADAIYVATAQCIGVPLVTWDREQRERTTSVIVAHTPDETN